MSDLDLVPVLRDGEWTVEDPNGGVWWPDEDALGEIVITSDPAGMALYICVTEPMRGEWRS